jgi:heterodisulfide reductase subunit A
MPASDEEIEDLLEEGIEIDFLVTPTRVVVEDGRAVGLELQRMELGEPDASGRRRPVPIEGSEFVQQTDNIIPAVSHKPRADYAAEAGLELTRWGTLEAGETTLCTSVPGLFAGGDVVRGPASVIEAAADGKRAAQAIDNYVNRRPAEEGMAPAPPRPEPMTEEELLSFRVETPSRARVRMPERDAAERILSFDEVELGYTAAMAQEEATRCLNCGVCSGCRECAKVCEADCIDYEMQDTLHEVEVGTVILATGFKAFDSKRITRYGYGRYDEVYTGLEFERLCNATGPTGGQILMKDGGIPESIGIVHCVGSRDKNYNEYCSRVCCMYALKFAHLAREKTGAAVYNFYIDMRCPGKGYEEFYNRLLEEEVRFVRGRAAQVTDFAMNEKERGKLVIRVEDTLVGEVRRVPVDMVVLATGLEADPASEEVGRLFGLCSGKDGWFIEQHPKLGPVSTATDGIFLAGACQGPKDIPDTVAQASGAAAKALSLSARGMIEVEAAKAVVDEEKCGACKVCNTLCPLNAISFNEEKNVTEINDALCKGCGTCAAACPSSAITAQHYTDEQIVSQIEGVLHDVRA